MALRDESEAAEVPDGAEAGPHDAQGIRLPLPFLFHIFPRCLR
jgi:hypothetical protein